jgi:hypothetical protein
MLNLKIVSGSQTILGFLRPLEIYEHYIQLKGHL